jgi:nicotinate-nucleotide pyrophosphorylase (carboxylating)
MKGNHVKKPDKKTIEKTVDAALEEDGARADATIELVGIGDNWIEADVIAGGDGVVCGVDVARESFHQMDRAVDFDDRLVDGDPCGDGEIVFTLAGPARAIIAAERVALNFLQQLSGIATLAAAFVARVEGTGVTILDTRKTTPLLRDLEKYAVRCGGAKNHRRDLRAMVLVKENHVRAVGGPEALIARLEEKESPEGMFVEVEVDSVGFLRKLLGAPVDRVMLDNFTPKRVREALRIIDNFKRTHSGAEVEVEVSGGLTLDNVDAYALDGVDFISVGALTHSAPALPMSLEVR